MVRYFLLLCVGGRGILMVLKWAMLQEKVHLLIQPKTEDINNVSFLKRAPEQIAFWQTSC